MPKLGFITELNDPRLSDNWQPFDYEKHSDLLHISLLKALNELSALREENRRIKEAEARRSRSETT